MRRNVFSVSTLPFISRAEGKLTHLKYFYHDYFTIIRIHSQWTINEEKINALFLLINVLYKLPTP